MGKRTPKRRRSEPFGQRYFMPRLFSSGRAQFSQAFTYIAIILVIGAIAALGAKAIISILSANCEAKKADFTADIAKYIDDYSDKGSVSIESVALPCDTLSICFVDAGAMNPSFLNDDIVMRESVRDGSYNVFVRGEFTEPVANAPKLAVEGGGVLCIDAKSGYAKLRFEGTGRQTKVSEAP
jgi:hypothetical protein